MNMKKNFPSPLGGAEETLSKHPYLIVGNRGLSGGSELERRPI